MKTNLDKLRRQSRKATYIAIAAALVIVGSLYICFHARQNLQAIQTKPQQTPQENAAPNSTGADSPQASKAPADIMNSSPELATAIPRVFIHMNGSSNVALAESIRKALKTQGFAVPIPDSIPPINGRVAAARLHYYSEDAYSKADLMKIQAVFNSEKIALISTWIPKPPPPTPPARTYALYLGRD